MEIIDEDDWDLNAPHLLGCTVYYSTKENAKKYKNANVAWNIMPKWDSLGKGMRE